jgi:hypothetical protein
MIFCVPNSRNQEKEIAALLDEPACAHNTKSKSGCARPKPGATAGGCAFDGAQIALLPIADVGADYVLAVKDNQPNLHEAIVDYFETADRCGFEGVPAAFSRWLLTGPFAFK